MTRAGDARLRAPSVLVVAGWGLLALLSPGLLPSASGTLDVATVLVVCVVAATLALTHAHAGAATHLVPSALRRWTAEAPARSSSRIPDPVHHPVSPRAPGLV